MQMLEQAIGYSFRNKALLEQAVCHSSYANEVGGTALLGISRPVIKAHGSSDARAIRSSVKQAMGFIQAGVIESIEKNIEYMRISGNEGG